MKNIGKPCAGKLHARFDEGGQASACSLLYRFMTRFMTRFMGFDGYVYLVPYVDELDYYFWKTVIPNRKAARDYLLMVFQLAFPSPRKFNTVGINAGRGINPALDNEIVQA